MLFFLCDYFWNGIRAPIHVQHTPSVVKYAPNAAETNDSVKITNDDTLDFDKGLAGTDVFGIASQNDLDKYRPNDKDTVASQFDNTHTKRLQQFAEAAAKKKKKKSEFSRWVDGTDTARAVLQQRIFTLLPEKIERFDIVHPIV